MRRLIIIGCALVFGTFVVGCGTSEDSADHPVLGKEDDGSPKWVKRGSGAYEGDSGKAFYGVGIMQGVRNVALARQTADNRARGEIAAMFDLYVGRLMKDYQESTTANDFSATSEEQDITAAQKTITDTTLRGVEVKEHWTDPNTQALYTLAVLRYEDMVKTLDQAQNLNSKMREHVRSNAEKAFDDLGTEIEQKNAP